MRTKKKAILLLFLAGSLRSPGSAKTHASSHKGEVETTEQAEAVLWRDPLDIASRDLYYGP
jgi:hypothetical protein